MRALRVFLAAFALLLSFGAHAEWQAYRNNGGTYGITVGGSGAQACAHWGELQWNAAAVYAGSPTRFYTALSGAQCLMYEDAAHTIYSGVFSSVVDCGGPCAGDVLATPQTTGVLFDGWCNSSSSCTEAGYSGGGGGGSTGPISLIPPDIFNISPDGGAQIALAILAVWACGWAIRVAVRTLRDTDGVTSENE